jgi:YbbR domain-containing protein
MNFFAAIRNWLIVDFAWKLFSLLVAIAVWFTVHRILLESATASGEGSPITYGNLPVTIVSANGDTEGYQLIQNTVTVTVTGPQEIIGKLQANQIHAIVDLSDTSTVSSGKQHVDVSVPPGITVVNIKPDTVGIIIPPTK